MKITSFLLRRNTCLKKEDPFYSAARGVQPFVNILPLNTNQSRFNINQNREIKPIKLKGSWTTFIFLRQNQILISLLE